MASVHEQAADIVASNPFVGNRLGFDSWIAPASVDVSTGDLRVDWPDGHISTYRPDWLIHHSYGDTDRARKSSWRPTLWMSELAADFPTVDAEAASDGDVGLLRLYQLLRDYGIVRIAGLGDGLDETERLANLVGPINETTVFGRIYDVRAEPVARLGAKTGMAQAPHIADAFYYAPPGIDVFHCVVNTEIGGLSTYVDGFAIADDLRVNAPTAFELLTTLPISQIRWHPGEVDLRARWPLISTDEFGRPSGIRYFDRALAPVDVEPDLVEPLYDAIREFNRRMIDPAFLTQIRVAPGDGLLIDNHRVLHGRTAFDPSQGRHVRLCQVTRDEFHARLRELSRRLDPANQDIYLPSGSQS